MEESERERLEAITLADSADQVRQEVQDWDFRVGCIHCGMSSGSREEPGTRLHAEQQFREGEIQLLVATEAAGEGIILQVCNILFNYGSRGTQTALSSGWGASTATASARTA